MERLPSWYSVIQYMPDSYRGEILNVGLVMHTPKNGDIHFRLLEAGNLKLKSLLSNNHKIETYKVQRDFIEYTLKNIPEEEDSTSIELYKIEGCLSKLRSLIPNGFILSEPTISLSENIDTLFNSLLEIYIGKEFLNSTSQNKNKNKYKVKNYFQRLDLLNTKVMYNTRIQPLEISDLHYTIDFVYKNGVINYIQTVPENKSSLQSWFNKMNTLVDCVKPDTGLYLFYNNEFEKDSDKKLANEMIDFLKKKNNSIEPIKIYTNEFQDFCTKIQEEGKDITEFAHEIA